MASGVAAMGANVAILGIGCPIYIAMLGADGYGLWLVLATFLSVAHLADLGMSAAVTKFVAEEYARRDYAAVGAYYTSACLILMATGTVLVAGAVLFAQLYAAAFDLEGDAKILVVRLLPYSACLAVYALIVQCSRGTVSGLGRMDLANYSQVLVRTTDLIVGVVLLFLEFGLVSLLIAQAVSLIAGHLACGVLVRRELGRQPISLWFPRRAAIVRLAKFGGALGFQPVLMLFLQPLNRLVLCRYAGTSGLAVYEIAHKLSYQLRAVADVAVRAIMPEISRRLGLAGGDLESGRQVTAKARRAMQRVALPLYAGVSCLIVPMLAIWLGPAVGNQIAPVFVVLAVSWGFSLLTIPEYYSLVGLGKGGAVVRIYGGYALVNVALIGVLVLLTGHVSPLGLAVTILGATVVANLIVKYEYRRAAWEQPAGVGSNEPPRGGRNTVRGELLENAA
jgi:O-antigen/teichoic acid export membrane protein